MAARQWGLDDGVYGVSMICAHRLWRNQTTRNCDG